MSATFSAETLPNRFDFAAAQPRLIAFWQQGGYCHAEPDPARQPFCIVIPPPNVTGALHLGHALNNTLQDVLIRMKRMQGFATLWMPGTDHAGIATQAVVEKRLKQEENKTRHELGREALVERIWQWKAQYEARIITQLKQMGCSCDWQRTRFTLDDMCARAVRATFFDLFRKQWIYRGKRLVNWDTFLQTAVSDDEVFQETVPGSFWHFRYPVIDPRPGEPRFVTIATTRPETMLGDTAVAVHPDPAAALAETETQLGEKLAAAAAKEQAAIQQQLDEVRRRREELLPHLELLSRMARQGRQLRLPLLDRPIPLVVDPWAKPELGSGCVKITPAHDPNDYEVGQRCGLPMINILRPDGTLNEQAGPYQGLTIPAARRRVVEELERLELVEKVEQRDIELPHSDRSKTPIEPYLADQWFVRMDQLAQSAIDAVEQQRVRIVPSRYAKGYVDWLAEKRDWPVSRQLWWGHQIPVWSRACDDPDELQSLVEQVARDPATLDGRAAWQIEAAQSPAGATADSSGTRAGGTLHVCLLPEDAELERRFESFGLVREPDVLDTWFSSALWPHSTLGWPERTPELEYFYPTSTLITSRDIITLWVARMVLAGLNNMGEVPFREVFIHPKILDGYGETMSKSKGNGVDPLDVIDKFGADALRYGLAYLTTQTQDVRMPVQFECPHCAAPIEQTRKNRELPRLACPKCRGEFSTQWARSDEDRALPRGAVISERFEVARNFCNKLWNASRFTLLNLEGFAPAVVPEAELAFEDHWILSRLATVTREVTESLEQYLYAEAARALYDFAWDEFCSFYVEMLKERFQDPARRAVAQRVVAHTLDTLLRLLHPLIPFLTEEVWQLLGRLAPRRGLSDPRAAAESVMIAAWPRPDESRRNAVIEAQFRKFQAALGALREIRSGQNIPPQQEVRFSIRCDRATVELLEPVRAYFASMAKAQPVAWGPEVEPPATHAAVRAADMDVYVDLHGLIDVPAEIARNEKQRERLQTQIRGKESKLANASFVERAPADVVEKERAGLAQLQQELAATEQALANLRKQL
ncbi:MAG: valine--tRNA ligase [Pirellulaceae bacterium]|nr:valine--tRNA ligase [Pirellulaceae bacterium]